MSWRDHLTSTEGAELDEHEWQRDVARQRVKEHSEWIAQIRNTCVQRARRKK